MHYFPISTVTKYHKLSGVIKQKLNPHSSRIQSPKSQCWQSLLIPSKRSKGYSFFVSSSSWWLLICFWLHHSHFRLHLHMTFISVTLLFKLPLPFCLIRSWDIVSTLNHDALISLIWLHPQSPFSFFPNKAHLQILNRHLF